MEEYLTVKELSAKIKFSKQSLYNLIHKGTFVLGRHYLKPTPKKILFKWSEIQAWMGESSSNKTILESTISPIHKKNTAQANTRSLINI